MARILCITLNPAIDVTLELERLRIGTINRVRDIQYHPAGKGLNVAQVLKDLGHDVYVSGFLGERNKDIFEHHFQQENFHNYFILVDGETRQNIKISEQSGQMTDINGKGFTVNANQKERLYQCCTHLAPNMDCIVIAGSLPNAFELEEFNQFIQQLKQYNAQIAIDTSGDALKIAMQNQIWLIKPNTDELKEAFKLDHIDHITQQVQLFQHYKIDHAVVSMGEHGVNWIKNHRIYHANAPKVTVKSTVGAGDTLLAGMIHGLLTSHHDINILQTATALASHAVTQIGFHIPTSQQLSYLLAQIQVQQITG